MFHRETQYKFNIILIRPRSHYPYCFSRISLRFDLFQIAHLTTGLPIAPFVTAGTGWSIYVDPEPRVLRLIAKVSAEPNKTKVGKVSKKQIEDIAKMKMPDLNCTTIEAAMRMVEGSAKSCGLTVEG